MGKFTLNDHFSEYFAKKGALREEACLIERSPCYTCKARSIGREIYRHALQVWDGDFSVSMTDWLKHRFESMRSQVRILEYT